MKKLIITLFAMLILSVPAFAENGAAVNPVLETKPLQVNFLTRKKGDVYPYLNYNDVTYIPLDGYHKAVLGIDVTEDENGIYITHTVYAGNDDYRQAYDINSQRDADGYAYLVDTSAGVQVDMSAPAATVDSPVYLAGFIYSDTEFPFFAFNNELYMPLSWQVLTMMDWQLDWDGSILHLYGDSRFMTHATPGATGWRSDWHNTTTYYQVSGKFCARIQFTETLRSMWRALYLSSGGISLAHPSHIGTLTNKMELKDGMLTIIENKYDSITYPGVWPIPNYSRSYDVYTVTRDAASGAVINAELTDRIEENMYGLLENSAGELVGPTPTAQSAYYDGGHVILNGTMMRSYKLVNPPYYFQSSYWIKAEDLESYGYDMVTDYENRATYFTRNPGKAITPMGFEGTNEELPIYDSDWKIYIDGKEPRFYYNIGGYTLIFAGELGEHSIEALDDNYYVMRVTTP